MIPWQDPLGAFLLGAGLVATWRMALDPKTRVNRAASLTKAGSSAGFIAINASLGLYISAAVSLAFVVAFLIVAFRRNHGAPPATPMYREDADCPDHRDECPFLPRRPDATDKPGSEVA